MPKTKLTLLLIAALLAGVCLGFFANSAIIKARIRSYSQMPTDLPGHITARLAERLNLDSEQQKQVRAVFAAYEERMQETREKSRAMYDSLLAEMSIQIDQYLTPEQKEEHLKLLAELDQRNREIRALLRAYPPRSLLNGSADGK